MRILCLLLKKVEMDYNFVLGFINCFQQQKYPNVII